MEEQIQKIKETYENTKYEDCLNLTTKILQQDINNFNALSYKGASMLHLGLFEEAVTVFTKCISLNSEHFFVWVLRGDAYYELKNYREALSDYWMSLQLESQNGAVLDKMGRTLFLLGDENRALEYIQKSIDIAGSPEPILVMMEMLKRMKFFGFLHELHKLGLSKFPNEKERFDKFLSLELSNQ